SVAVADVNIDGKPDLIVANLSSNNVSVLLNTTVPGATAPAFATQQTYGTGTGSGPYSVAVGDVNGDGKPDLFTANRNNNTASVFLNQTSAFDLSGGSPTGTIQDDDAPVSIVVSSGSGQSATVNTAFASSLIVLVKNAANNNIQG